MRRHDRRRSRLRASLMYASYHLAILHELPMGTEVAFPPQRHHRPPPTTHHQPHQEFHVQSEVVVRRMETLETQGLLLVCGGGWTGGPLQRRRSPALAKADAGREGGRKRGMWCGLLVVESVLSRDSEPARLWLSDGGRNAWQSDVMEWRGRHTHTHRQRDKGPGTGGRGQVSMITTVSRGSLIRPGPSPAAAIRQSVGDAMSSICALIGKGVSWTSAGSSIVRRTFVQLSSLSRALLLHSSGMTVISGAARSGLSSDKTNVGRVGFALLPARLV